MSTETIRSNLFTFFGDPHGDFSAVKQTLREGVPLASVFLGDFDLARPMKDELQPLIDGGSDLHWIHGNHDADQEHWHDFVFESEIADRNLTARVVEVAGIKIAGLGGVFHPAVWHPKDGEGLPKFSSRDEFMASHQRSAWRGGLPLRHRSTIFPEDFNALIGQESQILISHEAPSSHRYGHSEIDDLAEILGARIIVHGHHHEEYEATLPNGIKVFGLAKAGRMSMSHERLLQL
ncbi:metallophosphoesterase [Rhizobium sp. 2YAF20]|uniref:metallophosphoesterase family protein n=1 Tax=Rhizobium sp. 2YAF20 TaxID=3233027 RepID=UPI003F9AD438